jgi:hypothetical protein
MKLSILAFALFLGGCSALAPMKFNSTAPNTPESAINATRFSEQWDKPAVFVEGKSSVVLMTPVSIPDSVRERKISLELEPGATIKDLVAVLGKLGVTIIVSNPEAAAKEFYLPHFKGTMGLLLSTVTRATDVWFTWHEGAIMVSSTEKIGITVPQEANFAEQMGKGLESMGVTQKSVSWQAGMAVMDVTPNQFRKVKTYLERYTANAAVVTLQLAVVNVTLTQNAKQGIDWDKLQLSALGGSGNPADLVAWRKALDSANGTTGMTDVSAPLTTDPSTSNTSGTSSTSGTSGAALPPSVAAYGIAGGSLSAALFSSAFSFDGLFNFLQTYGTAETQQSVVLKTVAGNKVELKSLTQIPYVSEVGVTTTAGNNSSSMGSTKTAMADDGITVEMTPTYDAAANSVTVDFKLSLKAVIAFNELSAGNQLGTLTQPTTAERSFTDTLRVRPGETVVVGGLSYDSISNSRGSPIFLQGTNLESQTLAVSRQSTFIVLRPTIMRLGQVLESELGDKLDLLPAGKDLAPEINKIIPKNKAKDASK